LASTTSRNAMDTPTGVTAADVIAAIEAIRESPDTMRLAHC